MLCYFLSSPSSGLSEMHGGTWPPSTRVTHSEARRGRKLDGAAGHGTPRSCRGFVYLAYGSPARSLSGLLYSDSGVVVAKSHLHPLDLSCHLR